MRTSASALTVAHEEVDGNVNDGEGNSVEIIGLVLAELVFPRSSAPSAVCVSSSSVSGTTRSRLAAVTIRIVVCFAILAFASKFDFPPFMVLIISLSLLNSGIVMTLSVDRLLPSDTPDSWGLAEIFAYAVAYDLYLTLSTS